MPAVVEAARRSRVPLAIHLDHGHSLESAVRAVRAGCNGVMVDGSHLDFDANVAATRAVVAAMHSCGIPVEGELGYVPGVEGEDAIKHPGEVRLTSVAEARRFIRETEADCLAVSIGTVHGRLRGHPRLDLDRLAEIDQALGLPLVIHGGTGLSDDQYRALAERGAAKINYYTGLSDAAARSIAERATARDGASYTDLVGGVRAAIAAEVVRTSRVFGAAGRAAAARRACRPWTEVEHVVVYNPGDTASVGDAVAKGREVLSAVPGVRRVVPGRAVDGGRRYQNIWLIRFAAPEVIESYKHDPAHVAYADGIFRPLAEDRLTIDFMLDE